MGKEIKPKVTYNQFIIKHQINNTLNSISELSYTQKYNLLEELYGLYGRKILNKSLYEYNKDYIEVDRVLLTRIKNTLKGIASRLLKEEK